MAPPRLAPQEPFPSYTFIPGRTPHPISDPGGHSFGRLHSMPPVPDPAQWQECPSWLFGLDLFNHGYYWEAHEVWEGLWHACGRSGKLADFFKAMIHAAAAGVKVREGVPRGVERHLHRAGELLQSIQAHLPGSDPCWMGLNLATLGETLASWLAQPLSTELADSVVQPVFVPALVPQAA